MSEEFNTVIRCEFCSRSGLFIDASDPSENGKPYYYCPLCERGCFSDEIEDDGCLFDEGHDSLEHDEYDEQFISEIPFGEDFLH